MRSGLFSAWRDRLCPRGRRTSYALHQLDVKLEPHVRKRRGFFVEAGGNDGLSQSNTLYFERYLGWRGLLVEAIPALAEKCRRNRPRCIVENCALVSAGHAAPTVDMQYCNLMSLVKGSRPDMREEERHLEHGRQFLRADESVQTVTVPAKTLSRVLDEHGITRVDLLSLDVEGYEPEVLAGLDLARHRPAHLLVEVRDRAAIEKLLAPWYRTVAVLTQTPDYQDVLYGLAGAGSAR